MKHQEEHLQWQKRPLTIHSRLFQLDAQCDLERALHHELFSPEDYEGHFYTSASPGNGVLGRLNNYPGCVCWVFLDENYTWAGKLSKRAAFPKWAGLF